jgi:hypothetical protein
MAIPNYSGIKHFHGVSAAGRGSGDVIYEGTTAVTAGMIYYLYDDSGVPTWDLTDADSEGYSKQLLAVALGTGNSNVVGMLLRGMVILEHDPGSFRAGLPIYLSTDAGKATTTAPSETSDIVRIVGYSIDGKKVWFDPDQTWVELT